VGLSVVDVRRLVKVLLRLRDMGNTIVVVEHNPELVLWSDYVIDLGEGGGERGGKIIAEGKVEEVMGSPASLTGRELKKYFEKKFKRRDK
jgi:excinuclease ABC subunit A